VNYANHAQCKPLYQGDNEATAPFIGIYRGVPEFAGGNLRICTLEVRTGEIEGLGILLDPNRRILLFPLNGLIMVGRCWEVLRYVVAGGPLMLARRWRRSALPTHLLNWLCAARLPGPSKRFRACVMMSHSLEVFSSRVRRRPRVLA